MLRRSLVLVAALAAVLVAPPSPVGSSAASFPVTIHAANGDVVIKTRPTRVVSLSPTGDRRPVRHRRRRAGDRRRRPVGLPEARAAARSSPATRRTPRRSPAYKPDLVVDLERRRARRRRSRSSASPCCSSRPPTRSRRRTTRSAQLGSGDRPRAAATKVVGGMQRDADGADPRSVPKALAAPQRLPRARARLLLGDVETFIGRIYTLLRLQEHRRRGRHVAAPATRSSRPSTSSRRTPT